MASESFDPISFFRRIVIFVIGWHIWAIQMLWLIVVLLQEGVPLFTTPDRSQCELGILFVLRLSTTASRHISSRFIIGIFDSPLFSSHLEYNPELYEEDGEFGRHRYIDVGNDKTFHVVEAGDPNGPLVLFLHGFPQCWYAWRYQLKGLKDEGCHLVAMDMRGYATSYCPTSISDYKMAHLVSDVRSVIRALLAPTPRTRAVLVGHDWGAIVGRHVARDSWERDQANFGTGAGTGFTHDVGYLDRLVLINSPPIDIMVRNMSSPFHLHLSLSTLVSLARDPVDTWRRVLDDLRPLMRQISKSYYVYMFQLPSPLPEIYLTLGDQYFVQKALELSRSEPEAIERFKAHWGGEEGRRRLTSAVQYYRGGAALEEDVGVIAYPTLILWVRIAWLRPCIYFCERMLNNSNTTNTYSSTSQYPISNIQYPISTKGRRGRRTGRLNMPGRLGGFLPELDGDAVLRGEPFHPGGEAGEGEQGTKAVCDGKDIALWFGSRSDIMMETRFRSANCNLDLSNHVSPQHLSRWDWADDPRVDDAIRTRDLDHPPSCVGMRDLALFGGGVR
ncbi:Alpha/Beta hydrolase protein [Jimgerdemannia flammicorona]|uniref:Alpha/Beta hydrolase protein n=1 Tax=Jimgerdemannia flammicorona TaxID=994334 RepID=A0A433QAR1_9FUNG|nr:Alpha/Beta hydrolase protein [Jimgerdemannia flammicorona]